MKLPRVTQFCCGCTLYTGALVIGILSTLVVLASFIHSIFGDSSEDYVTDAATFLHNNASIVDEKPLPASFHHLINTFSPLFYTYDVVSAILNFIELLICLLFMYGVVKRVPSLLLPALVIGTINYVSNAMYLIAASILLMFVASIGVGLGVLLIVLICIAPPLYFMIVVYSFYMELKPTRPYSKDFSEPPNLSV